jgi:hypothetical protein
VCLHNVKLIVHFFAGLVVREGAARDRELRVLATGQGDVDRAFMESEFAKAR